MPQCQSRVGFNDDGSGRRCRRQTTGQERFCQDHNDASVQSTDTCTKAKKEAEGLEIVVSDIRIMNVEECSDLDDVSSAVIIVEKYAEHLDRAIRAMENHCEQFPTDGMFIFQQTLF